MLTRLELAAVLVVGVTLVGVAQTPAPQTPPVPALSALHQAQVEAHLLRVKTLQLEVQLQQMVLSEQRAKLEADILAAHPGYSVDWTKGTLTPAPAKGTQP